jgi:hypothetical protein
MSEPIEIRAVRGRRSFADSSTTATSATRAIRTGCRRCESGIRAPQPEENPFFAHAAVELMLAWRGDRVVGRIAAIDDRLHRETHRDNVAMFGFFEAADGDAARALLAAVEAWARREDARACAVRSAPR